MRKISKIVIHCSATRASWMHSNTSAEKLAEITRWHVEDNKWSDIGYHALIDRDGTILEGRPFERSGAHVRGQNSNSIGVCLIGGHGSASTDQFEDHFTPEQDAALREFLASADDYFGSLSVHGHNDFAAKACPGFDVQKWFGGKVTTSLPKALLAATRRDKFGRVKACTG